ncbi:hypothetical protein SLE2022_390420 [Rubroshorea leprosula]
MEPPIVISTPALDLAFTNLAYCSPADHHGFGVPGSQLFLANVGDVFVLSVSYPFSLFTPHESIRNGYIALNAIQRQHAKVSTGDTISVSRFIPPDNFNLASLTLELEFIKKRTKNEQVDAVLLDTQLKQRFISQVMTAGQRVPFKYHGNNYILTVNQAVLEGQEGSNAPERGLISNETCIIFEASNSSGIKVIHHHMFSLLYFHLLFR